MARPKKGEEKDRKATLGLRIMPWMRAGLVKLAKEDRASLSDVAYEALVAYLKRRGIPEPQR